MTDYEPQELGLIAKLVVAAGAAMIVSGIVWHGVEIAVFKRIWHAMLERPSGPVSFRFILQPLMAALAASLDGYRDARAGRPPYLWTMLRKPRERIGLLNEGLNATGKIMLLGITMDVVYQLLALDRFYPSEALIVALMLAFVPYVILRGLILRGIRLWLARASRTRGRMT